MRFINILVNEFQKGKECGDESFTIQTSFFEIVKPLIFVEIPYCELNEMKSKHFLKKFHKFTSISFRMVITWKTRNIRSLFPLKDKNDYKSCVIYKGDCSCGSRYVGETKHNASRVDSTEFAELAESAENHNFLSSLIKQPKNYSRTYSDTFSQILSVKNNSNSIFLQFCVFVCGPLSKNENAEFAEGFKKFIKLTESVLDSGCTAQIDHLLPMFI